MSKYHFRGRRFTATYGHSPAAHLSLRRVERAQDLLRATNHRHRGVGQLLEPRLRQQPVPPSSWASRRASSRAVRRRRAGSPAASSSCGGWPRGPQARRRPGPGGVQRRHTITNIAIASVFVKDIDASKAFYIDVLGFEENSDVTLGDGYRWCTVSHPSQPELQVHLTGPGLHARQGPLSATARARHGGRRLPQDLRGAQGQMQVRQSGAAAATASGGLRLRQLDGAGRAAGLTGGTAQRGSPNGAHGAGRQHPQRAADSTTAGSEQRFRAAAETAEGAPLP